ALIRDADDRATLLLGLVENVARENLTPIEEARGYAMLIDEFELSLGDVSERVGRSKPAISNKLRLLDLPDDVLAMVERGELTEGHARAVLAVPDQIGRRKLARKLVAHGMSVRAAERAARWSGARTQPRTAPPVDPALAASDLFLRMAHLSGAGELNRFLFELSESEELDAETKAVFAEVAQDRTFLVALEEYVHRTHFLH